MKALGKFGMGKKLPFKRRNFHKNTNIQVSLLFTVDDEGRYGVEGQCGLGGMATDDDAAGAFRELCGHMAVNPAQVYTLLGLQEPEFWCGECYPDNAPGIVLTDPPGGLDDCPMHGRVWHFPK